jgi:hypothetical protein
MIDPGHERNKPGGMKKGSVVHLRSCLMIGIECVQRLRRLGGSWKRSSRGLAICIELEIINYDQNYLDLFH